MLVKKVNQDNPALLAAIFCQSSFREFCGENKLSTDARVINLLTLWKCYGNQFFLLSNVNVLGSKYGDRHPGDRSMSPRFTFGLGNVLRPAIAVNWLTIDKAPHLQGRPADPMRERSAIRHTKCDRPSMV